MEPWPTLANYIGRSRSRTHAGSPGDARDRAPRDDRRTPLVSRADDRLRPLEPPPVVDDLRTMDPRRHRRPDVPPMARRHVPRVPHVRPRRRPAPDSEARSAQRGTPPPRIIGAVRVPPRGRLRVRTARSPSTTSPTSSPHGPTHANRAPTATVERARTAAGGIVEQHPDQYADTSDEAGREWLEAPTVFHDEPDALPAHPDHRARVARWRRVRGKILRRAPRRPARPVRVSGRRDSGESVEHIGRKRAGTGY